MDSKEYEFCKCMFLAISGLLLGYIWSPNYICILSLRACRSSDDFDAQIIHNNLVFYKWIHNNMISCKCISSAISKLLSGHIWSRNSICTLTLGGCLATAHGRVRAALSFAKEERISRWRLEKRPG